METVSSAEFQQRIDHYQNRALVDTVTITCNGHEQLVMMSVEQYRRLKQRRREVLRTEDFTEADLAAIAAAEVPAEHGYLDAELTA
jgi:prevent-host-death family protein